MQIHGNVLGVEVVGEWGACAQEPGPHRNKGLTPGQEMEWDRLQKQWGPVTMSRHSSATLLLCVWERSGNSGTVRLATPQAAARQRHWRRRRRRQEGQAGHMGALL